MTSPQSSSAATRKRARSGDDQASVAAKTNSRRKAACQACRARKVRCDQDRPKCGFCVANASECVYIESADERIILDPATRVVVNRLNSIQHGVDRIHEELTSRRSIHDAADNQYSPRSIGVEPRQDYLEIPTSRTTADAVLTWPIFGGAFEPNSLVCALDNAQHDTIQVSGGLVDLPQSSLPTLIDRFLSYVHTKNPLLDVDALVQAGRQVSRNGLQWDAESCIVLLACALGTISRPFTEALGEDGEPEDEALKLNSESAVAEDRRLAETFFILASRRLGLLKHTVLGSQCQFFAGVYLMYTFRPLEAWTRFYQASTYYEFFLKSVGGPSSDRPKFYDAERLQQIGHVQRRMEQSLFWSCFKSEVEMRVDLPLMQSSICQFEYPAMFPSPPCKPPTTAMPERPPDPPWHQVIQATYGKNISNFKAGTALGPQINGTSEEGPRLYNEEESWFYYLTEVALRRIENRIINTFYHGGHDMWMSIARWIPLAKEFEAQISAWSTTLPAAMQNFNDPRGLQRYTAATTRIPAVEDEPHKDPEGNRASASMELSWCTENRLLEILSCLYQPFLYHKFHSGMSNSVSRPAEWSIPTGYQAHYNEFISAGITCNLKILRWRTLHHRHHGIWFDLRGVMTAVAILCAAAQSGAVDVPLCLFQRDGAREELRACGLYEHNCISFDTVFARFRYWENESADIKHSRVVLERLVDETRTWYLSNVGFNSG